MHTRLYQEKRSCFGKDYSGQETAATFLRCTTTASIRVRLPACLISRAKSMLRFGVWLPIHLAAAFAGHQNVIGFCGFRQLVETITQPSFPCSTRHWVTSMSPSRPDPQRISKLRLAGAPCFEQPRLIPSFPVTLRLTSPPLSCGSISKPVNRASTSRTRSASIASSSAF